MEGAIGKHYSVREHFENLDQLFKLWRLHGISSKTPEGETRWDVYIPLDERKWLLAILGIRYSEGRHYLVSIYPINTGSVENRLHALEHYLFER